MRSLMNGSITVRSFEIFSLPVKVFSAIEDTSAKTHDLHDKCKTQINRVPRCPKCNKLITQADILTGYVLPNSDELAFLSDGEALSLTTMPKTIEILEFAPLAELDLIRPVGAAYYLGVNGDDSTVYRLFYKAMAIKQVFAIAYWGYRGKERLSIIRADPRGVLVLQPIYHNSEIRATDEVPIPNKRDLKPEYLKMISSMIDIKLSTLPKWSKYRDLYAEKLANLLVSRTKTGTIRTPFTPKKAATVIDLVDIAQLNEKKPVKTRRRKVLAKPAAARRNRT